MNSQQCRIQPLAKAFFIGEIFDLREQVFWSPPSLASSPAAFWSIVERIRLFSALRRMYSLIVRLALLAGLGLWLSPLP